MSLNEVFYPTISLSVEHVNLFHAWGNTNRGKKTSKKSAYNLLIVSDEIEVLTMKKNPKVAYNSELFDIHLPLGIFGPELPWQPSIL